MEGSQIRERMEGNGGGAKKKARCKTDGAPRENWEVAITA